MHRRQKSGDNIAVYKMRNVLYILFLLLAVSGSAQKTIRCNDSLYYMISEAEDFYCFVTLTGKVKPGKAANNIVYEAMDLKTNLVSTKDYLDDGTEDIPILINYMIKETHFYTGVIGEKLNVVMIPVEIFWGKKAVIWYFDIPGNMQHKLSENNLPVQRRISVSLVLDNYVYSIQALQYDNQDLETIQLSLYAMIQSVDFRKGVLDENQICDVF